MTAAERESLRDVRGIVFAIDQTATHDGPGLRMLVYLKGCPLGCIWCHSPESRRSEPQIVWYGARCVSCGACVERCPRGLRSPNPLAGPDPGECLLCEACVAACETGALEVKGGWVSAGDIVDQAVRQRAFFDASGGGVTLSGGEPALQPEFARALLRLLRGEGIHTAVETSGLATRAVLREIAATTDLFLYDLKHADDELHRRDTGASNRAILENLARLIAEGAEVIVRVPCIPGRNGTPETIADIARVARDRGATRISLLPYNPATPGKYAWLQRPCPVAGTKPQTDHEMRVLEDVARAEGLTVVEP